MSTVQQYFSNWNLFDEIKKLHQDYSIETFIDNDTLNKLWIFKYTRNFFIVRFNFCGINDQIWK